MSSFQVAQRYAKSLLEIARENNIEEKVYQDMRLVHSTISSNSDFRNLLKSPIIRHDRKRAILEGIFSGKVDNISMSLFNIVTKKGREEVLGEIAKVYILMYEEWKKIGDATLIGTYSFSDAEIKDLQEKLKQATGKTLTISQKQDKELIGGFVLKIDDRQFDASVKNHLNRLKNSLIS